MGTLREVIKKNMMNIKIVGLHYSDKQRSIVFKIFELVNCNNPKLKIKILVPKNTKKLHL